MVAGDGQDDDKGDWPESKLLWSPAVPRAHFVCIYFVWTRRATCVFSPVIWKCAVYRSVDFKYEIIYKNK